MTGTFSDYWVPQTEKTYDEKGRLAKQLARIEGWGEDFWQTFEYDEEDRVIKVTNYNGSVTEFEYDYELSPEQQKSEEEQEALLFAKVKEIEKGRAEALEKGKQKRQEFLKDLEKQNV